MVHWWHIRFGSGGQQVRFLPSRRIMADRRTWTDEELKDAIRSSFSIRKVLIILGLKPIGGNYKTFYKYVDELDIDISHFTGKVWNKGIGYTVKTPKPLEEILVEFSNYSSSKLRQRLVKEEYLENKCYKCGITEWNSKPISLELEHINGINTDNRIENLTILCPNCHSQTKTYRGRNIKNRTPVTEEKTC